MEETVVNASPIAARAAESPDAVALVDDDTIWTWAALADAVQRAAAAMSALAPTPGERIGVVGENTGQTLIAHVAGLTAGVGTVALSKGLSVPEMLDQVGDAGIVAIITGPKALSTVLEVADKASLLAVIVHGGGDLPAPAIAWEDWLAAATLPFEAIERPPAPILVYTSGTTGRARGTEVRWVTAPVSTAAEYLAALIAGHRGPEGPHLVVGPLQHNGPLTSIRNLAAGSPVVVLGHFDAERLLERIDTYRASSSVMVPTHFKRLVALPAETRARYDVSSMKQLAHTGSACPADLKRAMIDWFGPVLVESYGGSEAGTLARINATEWLEHPGSVGRAVEPFTAVVVDESGAEVPVGSVGLLAFRAPADRGISYHADPEKTAQAYVAENTFTLGDVGYIDPDGFLFITDRMSDMVVSGGVNLYPAESEQVLAEHPGVEDVAVIGVPHADLGEQLLALIVPADPSSPPDPAELESYCRSRIASYKCPKKYEFRTELERNAMNKLNKRALRRPYWDGDRTIG